MNWGEEGERKGRERLGLWRLGCDEVGISLITRRVSWMRENPHVWHCDSTPQCTPYHVAIDRQTLSGRVRLRRNVARCSTHLFKSFCPRHHPSLMQLDQVSRYPTLNRSLGAATYVP
jgi:hypothetical protein